MTRTLRNVHGQPLGSRVGEDTSSSQDACHMSWLFLVPLQLDEIDGSSRKPETRDNQKQLLFDLQQRYSNIFIPVLNNDNSSTDPFGRQIVVMSMLSSCSRIPQCRDALLKRARPAKRSDMNPHDKDRTQKDSPFCGMCGNIVQAQKYISKILLYFTPAAPTSSGPMRDAVHVYTTGTNAAMVSINGTPVVQNMPLADREAKLFHNGMPWYGGEIMRIGDCLSLINLHQQQDTDSAGKCPDRIETGQANSSWKALCFVLMSERDFTCQVTNGAVGDTPPSDCKLVDEMSALNKKTAILDSSRDELHELELNVSTGEKSTMNVAREAGYTIVAEKAEVNPPDEGDQSEQVEESSPMLTLHHFSASHDMHENSQFHGSHSHSQSVASTAGGTLTTTTSFTETEEDHLTLTHTEPSNDELEEGRAIPVASLSTLEMQVLRDEYSPNSFRHSLLSIALMRKERAAQLRIGCKDIDGSPGLEDGEKAETLPALLRDTVVVARRKTK